MPSDCFGKYNMTWLWYNSTHFNTDFMHLIKLQMYLPYTVKPTQLIRTLRGNAKVSVLSRCLYISKLLGITDTCFIHTETKADIFTAERRLIFLTVTATIKFKLKKHYHHYIYHSLGLKPLLFLFLKHNNGI